VLMRMRNHDAAEVLQFLLDEADIGQDQLNPWQIRSWKGDAAVDNDPFAPGRRAETVKGEVHTDLADAAQRAKYQFGFLRLRHFPSCGLYTADADATAPKCTSPAATLSRLPSPSRTTNWQLSSMVSKTPRTTRPSMRTATSEPRPAARASHFSLIAARSRPPFHKAMLSIHASERARNSRSASQSAPNSFSEVAGYGTSCGWATTLTPMPIAIALHPPGSVVDSSNMPASLALSANTSFGHLSTKRSRGFCPVAPSRPIAMPASGTTALRASDRARPATKPRVAAVPISEMSVKSRVAARLPSGVAHARPRRPRPLSCRFDTTHNRPGSPARACSNASALVEP